MQGGLILFYVLWLSTPGRVTFLRKKVTKKRWGAAIRVGLLIFVVFAMAQCSAPDPAGLFFYFVLNSYKNLY
jgi:hypothetical protein